MKEVVFTKAKKYYLSIYPKPNLSSMAKITLFAQIIQQLPKDLIKSLIKKHGGRVNQQVQYYTHYS